MRKILIAVLAVVLMSIGGGTDVFAGDTDMSGGTSGMILFQTEEGARGFPGFALGVRYRPDITNPATKEIRGSRALLWTDYVAVDGEADYTFFGGGYTATSWQGIDFTLEAGPVFRGLTSDVINSGGYAGLSLDMKVQERPFRFRMGAGYCEFPFATWQMCFIGE
jgi:hypothetical protein